MDPGLHVKQAINHLNQVLNYAPLVADGREATVHLTWEDWHVVADALFHMDTPREVFPGQIKDYRLDSEKDLIELDTEEYDIRLAIT